MEQCKNVKITRNTCKINFAKLYKNVRILRSKSSFSLNRLYYTDKRVDGLMEIEKLRDEVSGNSKSTRLLRVLQINLAGTCVLIY